MKLSHGDLWDFYDRKFHVVIPTNIGWKNTFLKEPRAVMGRGVAYQALVRDPYSAEWLGRQYYNTLVNGSQPLDRAWIVYKPDVKMIFFPTKPLDYEKPWMSWKNKSSKEMISKHLDQLPDLVKEWGIDKVAVPLLGAGNGGLNYNEMKELISVKLGKDPRFVLVLPISNERKLP